VSAANTHPAGGNGYTGAIAMTTIRTKSRRVKPSRHTARPDAPFGAGILPTASRRFEPSDEDRAWAAQFFGQLEDERRELEERALQAQWDDQFVGTIPMTGHCLLCGDRCDDLTVQGLCDRCDDLACEAAIKGENARAGLGYRVF
jgi:hypothetical protein